MHTCAHAFIRTCVHTGTHTYIHIGTYESINNNIDTCTHAYINLVSTFQLICYLCVYTCMHAWVSNSMYVRMHVRIDVCMYTHIRWKSAPGCFGDILDTAIVHESASAELRPTGMRMEARPRPAVMSSAQRTTTKHFQWYFGIRFGRLQNTFVSRPGCLPVCDCSEVQLHLCLTQHAGHKGRIASSSRICRGLGRPVPMCTVSRCYG